MKVEVFCDECGEAPLLVDEEDAVDEDIYFVCDECSSDG